MGGVVLTNYFIVFEIKFVFRENGVILPPPSRVVLVIVIKVVLTNLISKNF